MDALQRAEKAFQEWMDKQAFPIGLQEEHGFICGYMESQKECEHWERQYLDLRAIYHRLLKLKAGEDGSND
jgi:hypothetical protein